MESFEIVRHEEVSRYSFPAIIDDHQYEVAAELGVQKGYFSYYLLRHSHLSFLASIDSWQMKHANQQHESHARWLLGQFGGRSKVINSKSVDAAEHPDIRKLVFDFVYIDANHSCKAVTADIEAWWPKVRRGGCLAGHDYTVARKCGVIEAVNHFAETNGLLVNITGEPYWPSFFIFKP